jgi:hypothetical protein
MVLIFASVNGKPQQAFGLNPRVADLFLSMDVGIAGIYS